MGRVFSVQSPRRYLRRFHFLIRRPSLDRVGIEKALSSLQSQAPRILMVHSSLSACGFIKDGTPTVINALRDWIGQGTLAMPTHTYCYPGQIGTCEIFEAQSTPSRVGAITNAFWNLPGVLRSQHPTHSLACQGSLAEKLIAGHEECDTPCGNGTPYQRLVESDASVLMFGVSMDTYTLYHTAEDAAGVPYLYEPKPYLIKLRDPEGEIRQIPMRRQDMTVPRRFAQTASWLQQRGLLYRHSLGKGELLWIPSAGAVHEAVTAELRNDPWFLVAREDRDSAVRTKSNPVSK